jgi:hypothetical protein
MRRKGAVIKRRAEPDILRENAPRKVENRAADGQTWDRPGSTTLRRPALPPCCGQPYFLPEGAAEAPEPLKYLKKSELESITITSP